MKPTLTVAALLVAALLPLTGEAQNLEFRLISEKPGYIVGEPVVVSAILRNTGTEAVGVFPLLDPTEGFARYVITGPDGRAEPFMPAWLDEYDIDPLLLAPGEEASGFARFFRGAIGSAFARSGDYQLEGVYMGVRSAPVTIRVVAPTDAAEREIGAILLDPDVGMFLLAEGGEHLRQALQSLTRVSERHRGVTLSGYADYAVGAYWAQDARDFRAQRMRGSDPGRAETHLLRALESPITAYFRQRAVKHLHSIYERQGDEQKLFDLRQRFPREFTTERGPHER